MRLAESRLTLADRARLMRIERDLSLVRGRMYRVTYKTRSGEKELTGKFIRIGRSHDGSLREGLRFSIPNQTHTHLIDRAIVTNIEDVDE